VTLPTESRELEVEAGSVTSPRPLPLLAAHRRAWIGGLAAFAVAIYLLSGIFTVAADEQAVVRRFGRVAARLGPGIHHRLPWPVDRVDVIKTTAVMKTGVGFELPEGEARVAGVEILTGDTNIVSVAMTLQYVIGNPAAFLFDIETPPALVSLVAESVLTETVLGMPVDEVLTTGRLTIQWHPGHLRQHDGHHVRRVGRPGLPGRGQCRRRPGEQDQPGPELCERPLAQGAR
jgi:hypothetical protein